MPSKRPKTRFQDIADNINLIGTYTDEFKFSVYDNSQLVRDGVARCLSRISEAAVKLGSTAQDLLPDHDWRRIRSIGNILRHEYDNIQDETIWAIVSKHLLPLLADIQNVIPQLPDEK
ncbi:DUF86 domain-containing protein [Rhizobium sp. 32-5/1]|uniref:HepT-like ribonuclease domain-containing protein n=1 Tax=Rhizobium sp. 32-5/1 TaxID=3019602 RepID=UPI00240DE1AD|nr:HepT-like ribonuclease domain-containing protein [Rhizobium sp. 32-5/1]WEZ84175.1 DUF86 domain-containing protein [Rhizobium sp. 32-5/1]